MPPPLSATDDRSSRDSPTRGLTWKVRLGLLLVTAFLAGIFTLAWWLDPYDADGPRLMGTHEQLGLPECTFKSWTGKPCPSCGMTTSFALLLKGDVAASLRANWVGTLLSVFLLLSIPWTLLSVLCKRLLYIASLERALTWTVATFLVLLLVRWALVLI